MDTKSKKWKAFVSGTAFVLGVSLLLTGALKTYYLLERNDNALDDIRAATTEDYQLTQQFRQTMRDYFEQFLGMATAEPVWYGGNAIEYAVTSENTAESAFDSAALEQGTAETAAETSQNSAALVEDGVWQNYAYHNPYEYPAQVPELSQAQREQLVKNMHQSMKEDKNVLYKITYQGETVFTNAGGLLLDGPSQTLPDGYNFLLYFDGKTVAVVKDGQNIQTFTAGSFLEGDNWFVPGNRVFSVTDKQKQATVCIAAAKTPVLYESPSGWYGRNRTDNRLYWISEQTRQTKADAQTAAISLGVGALLFILYLTGRREKHRVDLFAARLTGKVWFEAKLVIVCGAVLLLVGGFGGAFREVTIMAAEENFYPESLWYAIRDSGRNTGGFLVLFWIAYLFINDLRCNGQAAQRSLTKCIISFFSRKEMKLPFQRRMTARFHIVFALGILPFAAALLLLLTWMMTRRVPIELAFLLVLLSFLPLLAQYIFAKRSKQVLADTGALLAQIDAIRGGNLTVPLCAAADADLARAAEHLGDIQRGMGTALEQQVKSERMKVELVTNVSHDIKTPLTSIISYVELLRQEEELPAHVRDYVRILDSKAKRLKTMVQDVFEVSKAASGQLPVDMEQLDLAKLIRQTLADMAERIDQSPVILKAELPNDPVFILADGERLYRVFQNLIQNALQYSLDGSRVYVTLHADEGMAKAEVKNTSKAELPAGYGFTERFVRGDQTRTDGGSGLGLSIAQSFTEACGGRLSVETIADLFSVTVEFAQMPVTENSEIKTAKIDAMAEANTKGTGLSEIGAVRPWTTETERAVPETVDMQAQNTAPLDTKRTEEQVDGFL